MFTSSQTHSHASTNAIRGHEYSRGLIRLLSVSGTFCLEAFLEAKGAILKQMDGAIISEKINVIYDTKTLQLAKSANVNFKGA